MPTWGVNLSSCSAKRRMLICFEITIDDIVAFNRYHLAHSTTIRNAKIRWVVMSCIGSPIAAFCSYLILPNSLLGTICAAGAFVIAGGAFAAIYFSGFHSAPEQQVRKLLAEGRNEGMLGIHELAIDHQGISETTNVGKSRRLWTAVNRIEETEDYAFLYITAISAHVIPKHNVTAGDAAEFIQRARELMAAANS